MYGSYLFLICTVLFSQFSMAALTPDQEKAKDTGIYIYNLGQSVEASGYLQVAAEAGDAESQYLMGNIKGSIGDWPGFTVMAGESRDWYIKAAGQYHVYAMMRLISKDRPLCELSWECPAGIKQPVAWRELALTTATAKATKGNTEAMLQLYLLTEELEWLIKSAEAGFAEAQHRLSLEYRKAKGDFATDELRQQAADKWLLAAAERRYIPAMDGMKELMLVRNNIEDFKYWVERGAKAGGLTATADYSALLSRTLDRDNYPTNLPRAYGLQLVIVKAKTRDNRSHEKKLRELSFRMTSEQIKVGIVVAERWQANYPRLTLPVPRYP